jgi:hypothetical protein
MSSALAPRVVVVRRATEWELLIEEHGTAAQARFYLERQGQGAMDVEKRHARIAGALDVVRNSIPRAWRSLTLLRSDLDRFVFEENDLIAAVGQDGLVANVAKYLDGQYVIGVNPDPASYEGVLVAHPPEEMARLLVDCGVGRATIQERTMVQCVLDDGQRLLALNEIFIGHQSHQSARYRFDWDSESERQSSSGLVVATGTGSTGWARSINFERNQLLSLPEPSEGAVAYFVREAFPGSGFATKTTAGKLKRGETLRVVSEMNTGGVIFGDGMEEDRIRFVWGALGQLSVADERLRLVC